MKGLAEPSHGQHTCNVEDFICVDEYLDFGIRGCQYGFGLHNENVHCTKLCSLHPKTLAFNNMKFMGYIVDHQLVYP